MQDVPKIYLRYWMSCSCSSKADHTEGHRRPHNVWSIEVTLSRRYRCGNISRAFLMRNRSPVVVDLFAIIMQLGQPQPEFANRNLQWRRLKMVERWLPRLRATRPGYWRYFVLVRLTRVRLVVVRGYWRQLSNAGMADRVVTRAENFPSLITSRGKVFLPTSVHGFL